MYSPGAGVCRCRHLGLRLDRLKQHLKAKESVDDLKSLCFAAEDAFSSLILPAIFENEYLTNQTMLGDAITLQECSFRDYLESVGNIKHSIPGRRLLKKRILDMGKYDLLCGRSINLIIDDHKASLRKLTSIHAFYYFRKGLAKYDFDKWESLVSEAKINGVWFDCNHELAYQQNLSLLLDALKNKVAMPLDAVHDSCQVLDIKPKMLAEINREYLRELIAEFNRREDNRDDHRRFKSILRNRFLEARLAKFQAKKIHYLPKDYEATPKVHLLSLLSPSVFNARAQKVAMLVKGHLSGVANALLEKGQPGRKYMSGLTNSWARLLVVGGTAACALTYAMRSKSEQA